MPAGRKEIEMRERKLIVAASIVMVTVLAMPEVNVALAANESNEGGISTDLKNEKTIRDLYDRFTEAWNRHDWKTMANMWTLDGDQQDPDGRLSRGRKEILALLKKQHETVFRKTKLSLTIDGVWFIKGDVALVTGDYSLQSFDTGRPQVGSPRRVLDLDPLA